MKVALLIAPNNFKDESLSRLKSAFDKWNVDAVITSYSTKQCTGYHGAVVTPKINAASISADEFDCIVLIDGPGVDSYKLHDFRPLLDTLISFSNRKKMIAAIGNSIKILARANIIANIKLAVPRDEETVRLVALYRGLPSGKPIEAETNIITIGNPDNVELLAEELLERLGAK